MCETLKKPNGVQKVLKSHMLKKSNALCHFKYKVWWTSRARIFHSSYSPNKYVFCAWQVEILIWHLS